MALKLHLGCGSIIKPGYVNIDEFNPSADVKKSILELDYPDCSVELAEGYMVLEHLDLFQARKFISNIYRMLQPGGRFILEVPDLEKVCRLILFFKDDAKYLETGAFGLRGIFGEPTPNMTVGDYHKWGYTSSSLVEMLKSGGFSKCEVSDGYSHNYPIRDVRIEAIK